MRASGATSPLQHLERDMADSDCIKLAPTYISRLPVFFFSLPANDFIRSNESAQSRFVMIILAYATHKNSDDFIRSIKIHFVALSSSQ